MVLQSVRGGVMGIVVQAGTTFPRDLERTDEFHERFPRDLLAGMFWRECVQAPSGAFAAAANCLGLGEPCTISVVWRCRCHSAGLAVAFCQ